MGEVAIVSKDEGEGEGEIASRGGVRRMKHVFNKLAPFGAICSLSLSLSLSLSHTHTHTHSLSIRLLLLCAFVVGVCCCRF